MEAEIKARLAAAEAEAQNGLLALASERAAFEAEKSRMARVQEFQKSKIKLDIGGHRFTTALATLTSVPGSFLARMFSGDHTLTADEDDGSFFIDRDGRNFHYVLNFLRDPNVCELPSDRHTLRDIIKEAEHYGIVGWSVVVFSDVSRMAFANLLKV